MTSSVYYAISVSVGVASFLYKPIKDMVAYVRQIRDNTLTLGMKLDLVMSNHLPHIYDRLNHIDEIILRGQDEVRENSARNS